MSAFVVPKVRKRNGDGHEKKVRKQWESMTQYMIKNLDGTEEIPFLFKDKMLKAGLLSFFIAVIGTYMGV